MIPLNEKLPDPKVLEKELSDFLSKKFGGKVKILTPEIEPDEDISGQTINENFKDNPADFNLLPEDLINWLDQYIIKQDDAKAILATKICTHFNRIKKNIVENDNSAEKDGKRTPDVVGGIKNNVLMIGPTGVGKTYMVKLIAGKIGVPFVKGDATKFSETGYVGGDVEDLVRDLVKEADGDVDKARYGIIYIDEADKIASSSNFIGADVSRTGVQRGLLKPMEETEVDLKTPHDPVSMIQEIERFRKTGERDQRSVNTKNILFILSGAFNGLSEIIRKRVAERGIGFSANVGKDTDDAGLLKKVKAEDLIEYGYESEFVGRLPVKAVFEKLTEEDLFDILKNPNNPIILSKRLDFSAYGIDILFSDNVLSDVSKEAYRENTGARGLVSAMERVTMLFERKLPSSLIKRFPVTRKILENPNLVLKAYESSQSRQWIEDEFTRLLTRKKSYLNQYIAERTEAFSHKYGMDLPPSRIDLTVQYYLYHIMDLDRVFERIKYGHDQSRRICDQFYKNNSIGIEFDESAVDFVINQLLNKDGDADVIFNKINRDFMLGLKLIREKTNKSRFTLTGTGLEDPENFLNDLVRTELSSKRGDVGDEKVEQKELPSNLSLNAPETAKGGRKPADDMGSRLELKNVDAFFDEGSRQN